MGEVGIRELRQHASRVIERVKAGETVTITDRGRPVARIIAEPDSEWESMIASGAIRPAKSSQGLRNIEPLACSQSASKVLAELREDER